MQRRGRVRDMAKKSNDAVVAATDRVRVNLKLSPVTHTKIRVWCAKRGVSMQSAIEKMLDDAFEKVQTT
jgi:hypothetical protein